MSRKFKIASKILVGVLALAMMPLQNTAYTASDGQSADESITAQISSFQFKYPTQHTFAEINKYYAEHPFDTSLPDEYDVIPDIANEEINTRVATNSLALYNNSGKADRDKLAGSLSQETLTNALNATNFIRYSAGLQTLYIHTNDGIGGYQWRAQAGAALMAELGVITHNVSGTDAKAAGIADGVFGWAKAGPGGSNIVAGSGVANKIVNSFMPDIGNDRTGLSHRSFILNPGLSGTGFGAANFNGTKNKAGNPRGSAVAMFVTYYGKDPDGLTAVIWPGNRQPIETFLARGTWQMAYPADNPYQGNPWSYFINTSAAKVDTSTFKVTLECDGKPTDVLDYNNLTAKEKSENRIFTIGSSPLQRLVAFRPHVAYGAGDKVTVTIEGIVDQDGLPIPVTYDVHFFTTGTEPHPNLEATSVSRTQEDTAEFTYTSDYAGTMYYLVQDADQTAPSADDILGGTQVTLAEGETVLDVVGLVGDGSKELYYITASTTATDKAYATAQSSGEMSDVKSATIEEYVAPPTPIEPTPDPTPVQPEPTPEKPSTPSTAEGDKDDSGDSSDPTQPSTPSTAEDETKDKGDSGSSSGDSGSSSGDSGSSSGDSGSSSDSSTSTSTVSVSRVIGSSNAIDRSSEFSRTSTSSKETDANWQKDSTGWWYEEEDGSYATDEWENINNQWYYFGSDGYMTTGWQQVNGLWYYMDPSVGDMQTGWQQISGQWYYMDPNIGYMKTGWRLIDGQWYYMDPSVGNMQTGWQQINGQWYYMDPSTGAMYANRFTPDGYIVNASGAWIRN